MKEYESKTDEEIKKLVSDTIENLVFFDFMIPRIAELEDSQKIRQIKDIFMTLALAPPEAIRTLVDNKVASVYEYYDKAGPLSCNGLPMFMSCNFLDVTDFDKFIKLLRKTKSAIKDTLNEDG